MEELLRIERGCLKEGLDDYYLSVYRGEIVYVQSFSRRDLHKLAAVIKGSAALDSGSVYLKERLLDNRTEPKDRKNEIYLTNYGREFSDNLSVAENMNMNSRKMKWNDAYSEKDTINRINEFFRNENISLDSEMPMWKLTETDKRKLDVYRAAFFRADLTVLDMTDINIEGIELEELIQQILYLKEKGMTYLVLSPVYTKLAEYASRIQYMYHGKDVLERMKMTDTLRRQMKGEFDFFTGRASVQTDNSGSCDLIGFFDSEWDVNDHIWNYLRSIRKYSYEIYQQVIGINVPGDENGMCDGLAIIPENSQDMLIEHITIGENLTIMIKDRIASKNLGVISDRLQRKVEQDFMHRYGVSDQLNDIHELSGLQKKILSVERYALAKPNVIFLESPYNMLEIRETPGFRRYLQSLKEQGMKIIYFSRSEEQLKKDCSLIVQTVNGRGAKISTLKSKSSG